MNAQHIIAKIIGFRKWSDLVKVTNDELEYRRFLFDNEHKLHIANGYHTEYDEQLSKMKPLEKIEYLKQILDYNKKNLLTHNLPQQKGFRINKAS